MKYDAKRDRYYDSQVGFWRKVNLLIMVGSMIALAGLLGKLV